MSIDAHATINPTNINVYTDDNASDLNGLIYSTMDVYNWSVTCNKVYFGCFNGLWAIVWSNETNVVCEDWISLIFIGDLIIFCDIKLYKTLNRSNDKSDKIKLNNIVYYTFSIFKIMSKRAKL